VLHGTARGRESDMFVDIDSIRLGCIRERNVSCPSSDTATAKVKGYVWSDRSVCKPKVEAETVDWLAAGSYLSGAPLLLAAIMEFWWSHEACNNPESST
jgi:hypothetical protein